MELTTDIIEASNNTETGIVQIGETCDGTWELIHEGADLTGWAQVRKGWVAEDGTWEDA